MHILVEGTVSETVYEEPSQTAYGMGNELATYRISDKISDSFGTTTSIAQVPYKIITDSRWVTLFCNNRGYFANVKKTVVRLTKESYKDLVKTLMTINRGEALLVNEANKKVDGKELKDVWTKQGVNILLGIEP
jgi:hypothetical protein